MTLEVQAADRATSADQVLLQGPHSRLRELLLVLRAVVDFLRGFRTLHFVGPCVTVFGSARFTEGHPYYKLGRHLGHRLADIGFTVMTGGGPGLMEAVNRGAREAGGRSVGCNIQLPVEQKPNAYLDRWVTCHHFFVRKVLLVQIFLWLCRAPRRRRHARRAVRSVHADSIGEDCAVSHHPAWRLLLAAAYGISRTDGRGGRYRGRRTRVALLDRQRRRRDSPSRDSRDRTLPPADAQGDAMAR